MIIITLTSSFPFIKIHNRKVPKIERTLDLELFFTFKDGTNIYVFKDEDISQMSSRHYEKLKTDIRMVKEYGMTRERRDLYIDKAFNLTKKAYNKEMKEGDAILELYTVLSDFKRQYETEIDIADKMWLDLYCMFFVLDTENELIYSPSQNAKKIELLNQCTDEEKELFFSLVRIKLNYYKNTLIEDTVNSLLEMKAMEKESALLKSLTNPMHLNSMLQNMRGLK